MRTTLFIALTSLLLKPCAAQFGLDKQWDNRFGGTLNDQLFTTILLRDGSVLLCGASNSPIGGTKSEFCRGNSDYWIVKINKYGFKLWDRTFGGTALDVLNASCETNDGGFILGGTSSSGLNGDKSESSRGGVDFWVVRVDSIGNKLWDKRFGGVGFDGLYSLASAKDGGFVLVGYSESGIGFDKSEENRDINHFYGDFWIVKIDEFGNKEWDKTFGGIQGDLASSVQKCDDGGYVFGGKSYSSNTGDKTESNWDNSLNSSDYWIVRTDSVGNKLWDKRYGGNLGDQLNAIQATADKGFILVGSSNSNNYGDKIQNYGGYWLIKIDSLGNKQWDKTFGYGERVYSLQITQDNGFLISGISSVDAMYDKSENNLGQGQNWIVKTDSSGNKIWDKTIFTPGDGAIGSASYELGDGCYISTLSLKDGLGGYVSLPNFDGIDSLLDYWAIKFCMLPVSIDDLLQQEGIHINVYPNPFSNEINITVHKENLSAANLTLTNATGRVIFTKEETNLSNTYTKILDLHNLTAGVYYLEIVIGEEKIVRQVLKQ